MLIRYILITFFLLQSFVLLATQKFIISAGALDNSSSFDAFYQSRIFVNQNLAPFIITNAQTQAFSAHGAVFCSSGLITKEHIIAAFSKSPQKGRVGALLAKSFGVMALEEGAGQKLGESLSNYLGAEDHNYYYEIRELASGEKIYSFSPEIITWPEHVGELKTLPAVVIQDSNTKAQALVVGRALGALDKKMALVDELLRRLGPNAAYIDLGLNQSSRPWHVDAAILQSVASRKPAALMLGASELSTLVQDPQILKNLPVCFPFGDFSMRQSAHIKFWSVAGHEKLWPLFAALGPLKHLSDATALMQKESPKALNIMRVFSETAALEAAKSSYVDLVLLTVDHENIQLPSQEIIEAKKGELAPIVRISALDISEVLINNQNNTKKVEIIRHAAVSKNFAGAVIKPEEFAEALPSLGAVFEPGRFWTGRDFDSVLAGMMLKETGADVAIFESEKISTPIKGSIDKSIARARLMRPGTMATVHISGKQLKKLVGLMSKKAFSNNFGNFWS